MSPKIPVLNADYQLAKTIYEFHAKNIKGECVHLDTYNGFFCIIVNVASNSCFTEFNYNLLNKLYEKYKDRGLRILAFPCNQFGQEEPGTNQEILQFASDRNVQFDMFEKINVNCNNAHPLWKFLKLATKSGSPRSVITSNFTKFTVTRTGVPIERLGPGVSEAELEQAVQKLL